MNTHKTSPSKLIHLPSLGIIGGGQLGKMMAMAAKKLSITITILDPDPAPPAKMVSDHHIQAHFNDTQGLNTLANMCDVMTYEREDIPVHLLHSLVKEGKQVFPTPKTLEILQDKLLQKEFFKKHDIPSSPYLACETPSPSELKNFGFPLVQKTRQGGYDGQGVQVIQSVEESNRILNAPSILEKKIDIQKELAIIVSRDQFGSISHFPVVEMSVNAKGNILDLLSAPADVPTSLKNKITDIATKTITKLDMVGVLAIELFLDTSHSIWVNEISGRPHNSGHYTIEACMSSQYEQHIRAIMGLPLGASDLLSPAAMLNILGSGNGNPIVKGLKETLKIPGTSVHIYGKKQVKYGRKMGHVVILDQDIEGAIQKAHQIKSLLHIEGEQNDST